MRQRFAKANARIQYNLLPRHSATAHSLNTLIKKFTDFPHDIAVNRIYLHRLRSALHVHAHVTGARFGHYAPHSLFFAVRGNVVDDAGARFQSGARYTGFHRVYRDWHFDAPGQLFNDRHDTAQFLSFADRHSARAGGFAADVDNFSALIDELQGVGDGCLRIEKVPAVGEGVRRDIYDPHDQRRPREGEFKIAGAKEHEMK